MVPLILVTVNPTYSISSNENHSLHALRTEKYTFHVALGNDVAALTIEPSVFLIFMLVTLNTGFVAPTGDIWKANDFTVDLSLVVTLIAVGPGDAIV